MANQATYSALQAAHATLGGSQQPAPAPAPSPAQQPAPSGLTAGESQLINLIISERTSRGLQTLQVDMRIVGTATISLTHGLPTSEQE